MHFWIAQKTNAFQKPIMSEVDGLGGVRRYACPRKWFWFGLTWRIRWFLLADGIGARIFRDGCFGGGFLREVKALSIIVILTWYIYSIETNSFCFRILFIRRVMKNKFIFSCLEESPAPFFCGVMLWWCVVRMTLWGGVVDELYLPDSKGWIKR